ncbi:MAG: hypothetical protein CMH57_05920 [Myxococcales bacterium]|nr:hypothetical protein [Myxococcales bacterium]
MSHAIKPSHEALGAPYRGELGVTRYEKVVVTGASGQAFEAQVCTQVNVTSDPALRASLLDGSLNAVVDPRSGDRYVLAVPVLYHDEEARLFALVLPDALRHQELQQRAALLERLEALQQPLPKYVRRFLVAFDRGALQRAEALRARERGAEVSEREQEEARRLQLERQELQTLRLRLEERELRLKEAQASLDERVAPRESSRPRTAPRDEATGSVLHAAVVPEPTEASRSGSGLTAAIFEPEEVQASEERRETTMVVSMDMFYTAEGEPLNVEAPSSPSLRGSILDDRPESVIEAGWELKGQEDAEGDRDAPKTFNRLRASGRSHYHNTPAGGVPLLSHLLDGGQQERFSRGPLQLYLQLHDHEAFPVVMLLLVSPGESGRGELWWTLDVRRPADRRLIAQLADEFAVKVALYGEDLKLKRVMSFKMPLELNAEHILRRAELRIKKARGDRLSLERALRSVELPEFARLGEMRHNFSEGSFAELVTPAETRLAAGIVGYWSTPEVFRYLIENRSFSLAWFARIQERVITAAAQHGIALTEELTRIGLDMGLAPDREALLRQLASTWAQVSLGLGATNNDLDPIASWENWQDLIDAMRVVEVGLEADLDELAKASLRRAQAYAQENGLMSGLTPSLDAQNRGGRGSEEPSLSSQLEDPERRLVAAQALLRRGDSNTLLEVLLAAEQMTSEEVESLSESLSRQARALEGALIEALELPNPTVALLCCMALSSIRSIGAVGPLLLALQDPERAPDVGLFAASMSMYGEFLLEALGEALEALEAPTPEHPLVLLLAELARAEGNGVFEQVEAIAPAAVELARRR